MIEGERSPCCFNRKGNSMDSIVESLNTKLSQWSPDVAAQVKQSVLEIIEMADQDILDIGRSRQVEQEVLDVLDGDEPW
jgi:hypothetical protein